MIRGAILLLFLLQIPGVTEARATDPTPIRRAIADPPLLVRAESGLEGVVEEVLRLWPTLAPEVATELGLTHPRPVEVVLLSESTFSRWSRGLLPEWGVGFANWPDGPIAIDVGRALRGRARFDQILRHEVSHVYLGQRLNGHRPPTWFVEGVAQIQSGEWTFGDTFNLVQIASVGGIPRLSQLQDRFPAGGAAAAQAYRIGRQAVAEIDRRGGERGGWRAMLEPLSRGTSFSAALAQVTELSTDAFASEVENRLQTRYGWLAAVASASSLFLLMTFLFLIGGFRTRLRMRQRLKEMEEEEALAQLLHEAPVEPPSRRQR